MNDLNEARKVLEISLGEDLKKMYFALLRQWFSFRESRTKIQFVTAALKLMKSDEQVHNHNTFMLALLAKLNSSRVKSAQCASDKGSFEIADFTDYVPPLSPTNSSPDYDNRSAAAELFLPDSGFIATRISIHAWDNGLDGADDSVSDYLVTVCQLFVKNILTAMITKKKGYKVREGKFQYSFGTPIPDPFIRNTNNIIDDNQQSKVEVANDEDTFIPGYKPTLECVEQTSAFSYSCGKQTHSDGKLTVHLLYDTLKENPNIIALNSVHTLNLLKIGLQLES